MKSSYKSHYIPMTIPIFEQTEVRSFRRSASCNRRWDDLWRDFPRINSKNALDGTGSSPNIWSSGIIWYRCWSPNGLSGESISGWLFQDYPTGQNLLREANGLNARLAGGGHSVPMAINTFILSSFYASKFPDKFSVHFFRKHHLCLNNTIYWLWIMHWICPCIEISHGWCYVCVCGLMSVSPGVFQCKDRTFVPGFERVLWGTTWERLDSNRWPRWLQDYHPYLTVFW